MPLPPLHPCTGGARERGASPLLVYYSRRSVPGLNRSARYYLLRVFYCCNKIYSILLSDSGPPRPVYLSLAELRGRHPYVYIVCKCARARARGGCDTKNHCSRSGYNIAIRNATRGAKGISQDIRHGILPLALAPAPFEGDEICRNPGCTQRND